MSRVTVIAAALIFLSTVGHANERVALSGAVSGDLLPGEYLVTSAVTVRKGEAFRVRAGTSIYFEQLAGIVVFGELSIEGEPGNPVALTSAGGQSDLAHGIDWNGIEAKGSGASVRLRHVSISNSVYGVNVKDFAARADLAGVIFSGIGYAAVMISGQEVPVDRDKPAGLLWDMGAQPAEPVATTLITPAPLPMVPAAAGGGKDNSKRDMPVSKHKSRIGLYTSGLGFAATGLILYSSSLARASGNVDKYAREDNGHEQAVIKADIRRGITMGNVGAIVAGAGLLCIGVSVFF